MLCEKDLCLKFLEAPNKNPKTGGRLSSFKGLYNQYTNLCLENGFEEEVGVLLLTTPMQDVYHKYFVQRPLFTEEQLDNLFQKELNDGWIHDETNDRQYKRSKQQ